MTPALLLFLLFASFQTGAPRPGCPGAAACRAQAQAAYDRQDYEAFHDLAWTAYRTGRPNDPALMLLVARAQSLSGRPGDALVMLERLGALGAAVDVSGEDFARVRALPRWPEVAATLAPAPPADPPRPAATETAPPTPKTAAAMPKPSADPDLPAAPKPSADPHAEARVLRPDVASRTTSRPAVEPRPEPAAAAPAATAAAATLRFSTLLTPTALLHDAVSKRYIIADRRARRIAVIDEHTGQVSTLVGALGALGDIDGMALDAQQGDLWVATSGEEGAVLHRTQLISGRVLSTTTLSGIDHPVVAMTFVKGTGLVVADASGRIWRVRTTGEARRLAALEYVPDALGTDAAGRLYVSAGAPRLGRYAVGAGLRRIDTVDLGLTLPSGTPFAVSGDRLHFVVPLDGSFELRSLPLAAR